MQIVNVSHLNRVHCTGNFHVFMLLICFYLWKLDEDQYNIILIHSIYGNSLINMSSVVFCYEIFTSIRCVPNLQLLDYCVAGVRFSDLRGPGKLAE